MFKLLAVICFTGTLCNPMVDSRGITYSTIEQCNKAAEARFFEVSEGLADKDGWESLKIGCVPSDFILEQ